MARTRLWGASPAEWDHLSLVLGLTADLLPVVSDPTATISPNSEMKGLGKTPSRLNRQGYVVGIPKWTTIAATRDDIESWSDAGYGACIQTRHVRALDIDIVDPVLAQEVHTFIDEYLSPAIVGEGLPCRSRADSGKRLLAFTLHGDHPKRVITTATGIIEFLANGQQFIAVGTHPSGERYEWLPALPDLIPTITLDQFESLWTALQKKFGVTPAASSTLATRPEIPRSANDVNDPTVDFLESRGHVRSWASDGRVNITCPWQHEHSGDSGDTETQYLPAGVGGFEQGHFHCLHAHCINRTDADFDRAMGISASEFAEVVDEPRTAEPATPDNNRFSLVQAGDFSHGDHPGWLIKGVLPIADMAMVYGEPGSGKSFAVLDMVAAIARGEPWRGHKVKQGKVVYVCAEGSGGFRKRLHAYARHHSIDLADIELYVVPRAPNLLLMADAKELIKAIGSAAVVVIDTLAQTTPGGDENAGKDMGKALGHCRRIHEATSALVILVHHSGKDASKGARGWSGLRGAADTEFEVLRMPMGRILRASKQKDGEDGQKWGFDLRVVPVGVDEDGDAVTSCVIEAAEVTFAGATSIVPKGVYQTAIVQALDVIAEFQTQGIEVAEVVKAAVKRVDEPAEGTRDRRHDSIKRELKRLCSEPSSPWEMSEDGQFLDIV